VQLSFNFYSLEYRRQSDKSSSGIPLCRSYLHIAESVRRHSNAAKKVLQRTVYSSHAAFPIPPSPCSASQQWAVPLSKFCYLQFSLRVLKANRVRDRVRKSSKLIWCRAWGFERCISNNLFFPWFLPILFQPPSQLPSRYFPEHILRIQKTRWDINNSLFCNAETRAVQKSGIVEVISICRLHERYIVTVHYHKVHKHLSCRAHY